MCRVHGKNLWFWVRFECNNNGRPAPVNTSLVNTLVNAFLQANQQNLQYKKLQNNWGKQAQDIISEASHEPLSALHAASQLMVINQKPTHPTPPVFTEEFSEKSTALII